MTESQASSPLWIQTQRYAARLWAWLRTLFHKVGAWTLTLPARWRQSLQMRVVGVTMVLGLVVVGGMAAVLAQQISDKLFEAKRNQVLLDAERTRNDFDNVLAAMDKTGRNDIQLFLRDAVSRLQRDAEGSRREAVLLRNPNNDSDMQLFELGGDSQGLITPELREQLRTSTGQYWQSVAAPYGGRTVPGIVVGQQVAVPAAGPYDLFLVYDLATEQQTLESVQRALVGAAIGLVLVIGGIAFVVTRLVVTPLQQTADVAQRLSQGELDQRLTVRGEDDLAIMARSFNDMADSLQDKIERMAELSRLQRRFVSDVSHELRTPLTTIRMAADVILATSEDFDPATRRSTELLHNQIDRFEQLLADLLEISRFDAGAAHLDTGPTDVQGVVRNVVDMVTPLSEARSTPLQIRPPSHPVTAVMDSLRMERVIRNLVVNAIEHGEQQPIDIEIAATDEVASIVVRDHGVGLAPAQAERVFDRFWRADPSRARTTGGTGLGLAISREDIRLHGGELEVWGAPGEGAAFRLTVPLQPHQGVTHAALPLPDRGYEVWWADDHESE